MSNEELYSGGEDLKTWGNTNAPDENLIYRSGVENQILRIGGVAAVLPNYSQDEAHPPRVVGTHTSKSVVLPVSCFRFTPYNQVSAYCFIRDNFYNIKGRGDFGLSNSHPLSCDVLGMEPREVRSRS
jgi:hypothetical protein